MKVVCDISKELVKRNNTVTVYTTDGCKKRLRVETNVPVLINGISVYYFKNFSNWLRIKFKIATPYAIFKIIKRESRNYDLIHIHEHRTVLAIIASHYAKKYKIPYIVQSHGSALPFFQKRLLKEIFDTIWGINVLKNASKVIALTETEAEQYRSMDVLANNIEIVPNGLDLMQFSNLPIKGTFRSKYSITKDEKIILFLARIHKIKGIDLLIDAYSKLLQEMPNIRLVIVGPDDNFLTVIQKQIQQLKLEKEPLFTGPLFDRDKLAAYVDADVYVLPSRYEIFGNTILEAWACGTPVVVTRGCQISNVVEKAGYTTDFDALALKDAISSVFNNEEQRLANIRSGHLLIEKEYNLDSVVTRIESLYVSVVESLNRG